MKKTAFLLFFFGAFSLGFSDALAISTVADCPNGGAGYRLVNGVCIPSNTGLSNAAPGTIVIRTMNWLMGIMGVLAMIMFVISGWMYLTAAGDEKKTEEAKNNIKLVIIGISVALCAFVIVKLLTNLLGASTAGVGVGI